MMTSKYSTIFDTTTQLDKLDFTNSKTFDNQFQLKTFTEHASAHKGIKILA